MVDQADAVRNPEKDVTSSVRPAALMVALGVAAAIAAGSLLWLSQGAGVFVSQAFAAFLGCF